MSLRNTDRPLTAGELVWHRVTIHAPAGVVTETPMDVATGVPAAIHAWPQTAQPSEAFAAGALQTQTFYGVALRYRGDLTLAMVLREECHTQRQLQILAIVPSDRGDALDLRCVTEG
jgi:head-tail adaptor